MVEDASPTQRIDRSSPRNTRTRHVAVAAIGLAWVATLAVNAPGHLSFDSVVQLEEGRSRIYAGLHPPLMSALLGLFDSLLPGTALYLAFAQSWFFLSLIAIAWSADRIRWAFFPVLIGICATPLVFVYQGIVWKDVLFANFGCAAFALALVAERRRGRGRLCFYVLAAVAAALAGMTRQNGLFIPVILGGLVGVIESRAAGARMVMRMAAGAVAGIVVFMAASWALTGLIEWRSAKPMGSTVQVGTGFLLRYDIYGMVVDGSPATLDVLAQHGLDAAAIRSDAERFYGPDRLDGLVANAPTFTKDLGKLNVEDLAAVWMRMILADPGAYLRHRAAVFRWMLWPPDIMKCLPLHVGVTGDPATMAELGLTPGARPGDRLLYERSQPSFATPLFRHGFYLLFAIVLSAFCLRRRRCGDVATAAMLVSAILFALSWSLLGIACDFRYIYFLPLAVMQALVMLTTVSEPPFARSRTGAESGSSPAPDGRRVPQSSRLTPPDGSG